MRKFAKMSLVAAVAVAGLSSTLSAQPLEEAIKGVDVSGMVRYRFESVEKGTAKSNTNNYRIDVKTSAKVNDAVKANVTVGTATGNNDNTGADVTLSTEGGDVGAALTVRDANFAISLAGATVIAGKQSIPGPFVDNSADDIARGTGVVALLPLGPVTLAAGSFNNTNAAGGADASELAVIAKIGDVTADLWYANVAVANEQTAYSAHVAAAIAGIVNLDVRHTSKDNKVANADKATLTKVVASGKAGPVTLAAGYLKSGKNNAATNNVSVDGDNDAAVDAKVFQASMGKLADATGLLAVAGMNLTPELSAKLTYLTVNLDTANIDASETLLDVGYAMSKNFALSGKYSVYTQDATDDSTKVRIEAKYTF